MALNVPDGLWDKYREAADWFIDSEAIGENCTLVYPPKKIPCNNCTSIAGSSSTNVYKHGGPMPFSFGNCPLCGGNGYHEEEVTGSIRLRIYWSRRYWLRFAPAIDIPDARVMVIGYMSDLPNLMKANEIILVSAQREMREHSMQLAAKPFPHGFFKDRYFMAFLKGT